MVTLHTVQHHRHYLPLLQNSFQYQNHKLYFVAETKGTENINDLKGTEKKKILCGRKHFEVIDTGIKYEVVKELKTLKMQ